MSNFDWAAYYDNRRENTNAIVNLMKRMSNDPSYGKIYIKENFALTNLLDSLFQCYPAINQDELDAIKYIKDVALRGCVTGSMDYPRTIALAISTKKTIVQMSQEVRNAGDNFNTIATDSCKVILANIVSDIYNDYRVYSSEPIGTGYIKLIEIISYIELY